LRKRGSSRIDLPAAKVPREQEGRRSQKTLFVDLTSALQKCHDHPYQLAMPQQRFANRELCAREIVRMDKGVH